VSPLEGAKTFQFYRPNAHAFDQGTVRAREVDVVGLATFRHELAEDPVPPRPARAPQLPGFKLADVDEGTYYTVYSLRAAHPISVTARQLGRLALSSPYELERERG